MKRAKFDEAAQAALTDCVKKIETSTDAELVLIVRARSGSYRHADYLFAFLLSFVGLLFLLFSPINFHEYWVAIDVAVLFVIGSLISSRSNVLRRLFTTEKFRNEAVRRSEERLRLVQEATGLADFEATPGEITQISEALIEQTGLPPGTSSLSFEEWMAIVHPADTREPGGRWTGAGPLEAPRFGRRRTSGGPLDSDEARVKRASKRPV